MNKTLGLILVAGVALWWLSKQSTVAQQQASTNDLASAASDITQAILDGG